MKSPEGQPEREPSVLRTPASGLFRIEGEEGPARAGRLSLPHGEVLTPAFMPVGTYGAVRGLHPQEVEKAGAQIILGNTYHLHLRPGEATVQAILSAVNRIAGTKEAATRG